MSGENDKQFLEKYLKYREKYIKLKNNHMNQCGGSTCSVCKTCKKCKKPKTSSHNLF